MQANASWDNVQFFGGNEVAPRNRSASQLNTWPLDFPLNVLMSADLAIPGASVEIPTECAAARKLSNRSLDLGPIPLAFRRSGFSTFQRDFLARQYVLAETGMDSVQRSPKLFFDHKAGSLLQ